MFLINWIDKKLEEIKKDAMFIKYFENITIQEIEKTYYFDNPEAGIDIVLSDNLLAQSIHLAGNSNNKHIGEIPFNLNFSMSRDLIIEILGSPNQSGGGYKDMFGYVLNWDKYFFDGYSLHLQYYDDMNKIELITIASLSLESYFNIGLQ